MPPPPFALSHPIPSSLQLSVSLPSLNSPKEVLLHSRVRPGLYLRALQEDKAWFSTKFSASRTRAANLALRDSIYGIRAVASGQGRARWIPLCWHKEVYHRRHQN